MPMKNIWSGLVFSAAIICCLGQSRVLAADPPLTAGNPLTGVTHQEFSGTKGTNTAGGALNALNAFKAAIGGADNGGAPHPAGAGFRTITWDGVAVDGTDFGGVTTVIVPNKIIGIPLNRFETRGVMFEEIYAVSADGFKSANANVNAANPPLFDAFSPTKTFAMFNDNSIGLSFVLRALPISRPIRRRPAGSVRFFVMFAVTLGRASSISTARRASGNFLCRRECKGRRSFSESCFLPPLSPACKSPAAPKRSLPSME